MDFAFDETQKAIRQLCKKMLAELVTEESLKTLEADQDSDGIHHAAWSALAQSQMLGIALPEAYGGAGLGCIELLLLLQQVGRTVAPIPALPTLVMGAATIAEFGNATQKDTWLPEVIAGKTLLTAALAEPGSRDPTQPSTQATQVEGGWRLDGIRHAVPCAAQAARILVPADCGDGKTALFLVSSAWDGVSIETGRSTNGEQLSQVTLDGVIAPNAEILGEIGDGARIVGWMVQRTLLGMCAIQLGVAEQAMFMTAKYTNTRHQFEQPIGMFQAVSQRMGDTYIDVTAMRITLWQAAWRIAQGLEATRELYIARYWACSGGHRVVAAAQHIHGGTGFDRDYPLHRYFLWSKQLEFTLGSAQSYLAKLGRMIAEREEATP